MLPSLRTSLFATPAGKGEEGYVPAHVDHVMLFCPKLTQHLAAEDPARLADQVLFYTSIANPVPHATIAQQTALANALIDFASSQHSKAHASAHTGLRKVAVTSTGRRLVSVEVHPQYWMHAVR